MGNGDHGARPPHAATGERIRQLRIARALSRRELAERVGVDVTSVAGWEGGKRLPRDGVRLRLAQVLGTPLNALFASGHTEDLDGVAVSLLDTVEELPDLLLTLTGRAKRMLRALRLAAPYSTAAHVQMEWRSLVSARILDGTLEVHRIEIFYDLKRLQETLSNILRYDGCRYYVKCHCPGVTGVVPAIGGYFFDDDEFLLGAYWAAMPPHDKPGLRASGGPFRTFYNAYWNEIWSRGVFLNMSGSHDLSAVQTLALQMGLPAEEWNQFVKEAERLDIGDNAPPLI